MLANPYNPSGVQWAENHYIQGRISQEDFYFLKSKYPYYPGGLVDKIVSIAVKKVIDELRRIDQETPIDTALYVGDESYRVLDDVMSRLQVMERRAVGEDSVRGPTSTQHVTRTVDLVHSAMQRAEVERPVQKGRAKTRKRSAKSTKKKEV